MDVTNEVQVNQTLTGRTELPASHRGVVTRGNVPVSARTPNPNGRNTRASQRVRGSQSVRGGAGLTGNSNQRQQNRLMSGNRRMNTPQRRTSY